MFDKFYNNIVIEKTKFTLLILTLLLLTFGYFSKDFQLDASSDTLLLENDPDLKYLREVNYKYGTKEFLVLIGIFIMLLIIDFLLSTFVFIFLSLLVAIFFLSIKKKNI